MAKLVVMGTCDTKGHELEFVAGLLKGRGHDVKLVDVGSGADPVVATDVSREEVASAGQVDLAGAMQRGDRGECVTLMSQAAATWAAQELATNGLDGILSLGGGGGTAIGTAAMRALPIGIPKVMVSTLASGNTAPYVGTKDIVMFPSIVDVAGLNSISRTLFTRAAAALAGMVEVEFTGADSDHPLIAASMFGNTTDCVNHAREIMEAAGYEVLVFHATGTGGRTMESLVQSGMVRGVLDITTTEWADEWVGGVLSAGSTRLDAAAQARVPAIVVPGCLDMVNFGERPGIPEKFEGRNFYIHNPQVTLMRTNAEECAALGKIIAEKVNAYTAPAAVLLPLKAISVISAAGQPFHDPQADQALFDAIRDNLREGIPLIEKDLEINDPAFARACAETLLGLILASE